MLLWFYRLPLWFVIFGSYLFAFIWTKFAIYCTMNKGIQGKVFRYINLISLLLSLFLIFYATLHNRTHNIHSVSLVPFQWIIDGLSNPEEYRTTLMNVVLYIPFGLTFPRLFSIRYKSKSAIFYTLISALILSTFIETLQYCCVGGVSQIDDVISNTIGAVLGAITILYEKYKISKILKNYNFK